MTNNDSNKEKKNPYTTFNLPPFFLKNIKDYSSGKIAKEPQKMTIMPKKKNYKYESTWKIPKEMSCC